MVLHEVPPSVEYCKVDPVGHGAVGAEIEPPEGVPPTTVQVLFVTITRGAGVVSTGQAAAQAGVDVAPVSGVQVLFTTPLLIL